MNIYEERPETVTTKVIGGYITYIYLEVRELTEDELAANGLDGTQHAYWTAQETTYKHEQPLTEADYGQIVNAIIRSRYTSSEMESITNNYLQETDLSKLIDLLRTTQNFNKLRLAMNEWLSSRDQDVVAEYEKMQEWRKKAKEAARTAIGIV